MNANVGNTPDHPPRALSGEPLRKSGLEVVGDVPWGTHFCQFYASGADLLDTLVPYFAAGLAANEFCMWVTSEPLRVQDALTALRRAVPSLDEYLASGQIEIIEYSDWYTATGRFDADRVSQGWLDKLDAALVRGFDGLRLTGNTCWIPKKDWEAFVRYEAMVDRVIPSKRMVALCTYSLEKCGMPEVFDVIGNHDFALMKEDGRWRAFKSFARQRVEQAIRESEARLRAAFEGATDGIITTDETGLMLSLNSAVTRIFGYGLSDLIGENVGMLLRSRGSGHRLALLDPRNAVEDDTFSANCEGEGRRKDGSLFPIEWTIAETQCDRQRLFVVFVRDLSERHMTEARMQKLQADRLDAMGGMAAAVAHEVNQPLAATSTYVTVARKLLGRLPVANPADIENALASAADQIRRAGQIVGHLRGFVSRGEPDKTLQSVSEMVQEAHGSAIAATAQSSVEASFRLDAACDRVLADKIQIQQVLTNLIRNAIEAMSASPTRKLAVSSSIDGGGMIRIDVADTGPGLPREVQNNLFEPFNSTKATGMGVGLSISRSIIEAHHGELWAGPNPEGGTIFSFTLPLAEEAR